MQHRLDRSPGAPTRTTDARLGPLDLARVPWDGDLPSYAIAMFPHHKLDWTLSRLTRQIEESPSDLDARLAFIRASISKARFHGGEATRLNDALTAARRILHHEPGHPEAVLLAGLTLVLLDRAEAADRYLDEIEQSHRDDPRLHLALGEYALQTGRNEHARSEFEAVVRLAPEAWEGHAVLGRHLAARLLKQPNDEARAIVHAQYHLVRALQLGPSGQVQPGLTRDLALLCMQGRGEADAERLLQFLVSVNGYRATARFHLGRVAARRGKHKKAILFFRQYLDDTGRDDADAWTRIGTSYLHLGEPSKARESCNHALAIDPRHLEARWVLGSALVAEERPDDAVRVFRELLEVAPDHQEAFAELVRMRTVSGEVRWLRQALRSETAVYDRLPIAGARPDGAGHQVAIDPRSSTRARIDVLVRGLGRIDEEVTQSVLACLDLTTDEGLRFHLWEGVLQLLARKRARELADVLADAGHTFSPANGRDALTLASSLDPDALIDALAISDDDLRQAAVERHGPADDVAVHRSYIGEERRAARAWQALLLLALARTQSGQAHSLLVRWASDADEELARVARIGLALAGDPSAVEQLRTLAAETQLGHLAEAMVASAERPSAPKPARLVKDRDDLTCATCGRRGTQVSHMLLGQGVSICNVCATNIAGRRADLQTRNPEIACALTGATLLDAEAMYVYQGVAVSESCIEQSVGHEERETVASYLASL